MDDNLNSEGNIEIEKALKEFEAKSQIEQVQRIPKVLKSSEVPKMVQLVMKWSGGAIKEQKQAEYVLLGFTALAIIVSLFLVFGKGTSKIPSSPPPTPFQNDKF